MSYSNIKGDNGELSLFENGFSKIEKRYGKFMLPTWINDNSVQAYYFPTLYAAKQFRKTHKILNGVVVKMETITK